MTRHSLRRDDGTFKRTIFNPNLEYRINKTGTHLEIQGINLFKQTEI
jgi:hypothetical protein